MKRLLSLFSVCALMGAQILDAKSKTLKPKKEPIITCVNVDRSGNTAYTKELLSDWDSVIAEDHSKIGKKFKAFWFGPTLWKSAGGIKDARHNGQRLEGLAAHLDYMIAKEPKLATKRSELIWKLNKAEPHVALIQYYQQLQAQGVRLIIATNNDYETLAVKTRKLNRKLRKKGNKPLTYDAVYCAGSCPELVNGKTPDGKPAGSVWRGKFTNEYFEKLFRFSEENFGTDRKNTLFIFVDDLKHNIDRACRVAKREGVALIAVHKNTSDEKIVMALQETLSSLTFEMINKKVIEPLRKELAEMGTFVVDQENKTFVKA